MRIEIFAFKPGEDADARYLLKFGKACKNINNINPGEIPLFHVKANSVPDAYAMALIMAQKRGEEALASSLLETLSIIGEVHLLPLVWSPA